MIASDRLFYINGQWSEPDSPTVCPVINPATEAQLTEVSLANKTDVNQAVIAANHAFHTYSHSTVHERIELLETILNIYERRQSDVGEAISMEMGAPIDFATKVQAGCGSGHLISTLKALRSYSFTERINKGLVCHEPIGTCALITPWNWPINQIACKVAPALACGCTVVLKPSELAPLSARLFSEILHEAGVPQGVFNMINGDGKTAGTLLCQHSGVDMVSFTGSTRAGTLVAQNSAATIKRVCQELGGKSANIILADADLSEAIPHAVNDCFGNSGQSCNALSRLLVPKHQLKEVEALCLETVNHIIPGDPKSPQTTMGPLISQQQYNKVQTLIQGAIEEGATLLTGGLGKPENIKKGYFARPTIFTGVSNDMTIAREEVFGPVLSIIPYDTEKQALFIANDTSYGLSAHIASHNHHHAQRLAKYLRCGMVHINGAECDFDLPFGGYKHSGNGREWGRFSFDDYLETKAIMGYFHAEEKH